MVMDGLFPLFCSKWKHEFIIMIIKKEGESEREIRYWQDSILEETKLIGSSREMWLQMCDYLFFFLRQGKEGVGKKGERKDAVLIYL